jgi:hypothetical protein
MVKPIVGVVPEKSGRIVRADHRIAKREAFLIIMAAPCPRENPTGAVVGTAAVVVRVRVGGVASVQTGNDAVVDVELSGVVEHPAPSRL